MLKMKIINQRHLEDESFLFAVWALRPCTDAAVLDLRKGEKDQENKEEEERKVKQRGKQREEGKEIEKQVRGTDANTNKKKDNKTCIIAPSPQ